MNPQPTSKLFTSRPLVKRLLMTVALLVTAFHLFATFLWVAPTSALRQVLPGDLLSEYMIPLWGQSWSVFAPEPINGDYYFDVRAVIDDGKGAETETQWVRATDIEMSHATYRLFPPRAAGLGIAVSSNLKAAWTDLPDDQKEVVKLDYFKGEDSIDRLTRTLKKYPDDDAAVGPYLKAEATATKYATQVAQAIWGEDDVLRVQYQASRKNVVPFAKRNKAGAERPPIQVVPTGWRALESNPDQSNEKFTEWFCSSDEVRCVSEL